MYQHKLLTDSSFDKAVDTDWWVELIFVSKDVSAEALTDSSFDKAVDTDWWVESIFVSKDVSAISSNWLFVW